MPFYPHMSYLRKSDLLYASFPIIKHTTQPQHPRVPYHTSFQVKYFQFWRFLQRSHLKKIPFPLLISYKESKPVITAKTGIGSRYD